jgi:hypothetical protein
VFAGGFGFGAAFIPGTATAAPSAVTDADEEGTDAAGASELPPPEFDEDELDFVAAPIANAIPSGITSAASSSNQLRRT